MLSKNVFNQRNTFRLEFILLKDERESTIKRLLRLGFHPCNCCLHYLIFVPLHIIALMYTFLPGFMEKPDSFSEVNKGVWAIMKRWR